MAPPFALGVDKFYIVDVLVNEQFCKWNVAF